MGVTLFMKKMVNAPVPVRMKQDGPGRLPVPSGATDFLVVAFQASRKGGVDNRANVRFVDTHAEGDGCDNDVKPA